MYIKMGQELNTNDEVDLSFNYKADGSALNNFGIGFYNATPLFTVVANGNVGAGTTSPASTFEVGGAFATKLSTQSGSTAVTLDNTASVWYFTGTATITLPSTANTTNRRYTIVNRTASAKTISSFTSLAGTATTSIAANSSIEIISNGSAWLQIR